MICDAFSTANVPARLPNPDTHRAVPAELPPPPHTHPSEAESFCCNHTQLQATKAAAIAAAATGGVRHVTKPKA